jgi:hypothetical protein
MPGFAKSRNPKFPFSEKGRGHVWRPCAGESSCLVHVCVGGVFEKEPVDRICGVPVRAKEPFQFCGSKERTILCGSWSRVGGLRQSGIRA